MSVAASNLARTSSQDQALYWTDDLPVCFLSGVGSSTNQVYRDDGVRREEHPYEDRSFHFKIEDDICLYGVFDGHDGCKASNFAAQRMPAELLLGQLRGKTTDDEVKQVLHQAFVSVEKGFQESIDDFLAEKAKLVMHVPEGISYYEASTQYQELFKQLEAVERDIKGGSMAVVVLIIKNRLYVANVGCCRALLCKVGEDGVLRVSQLSVDHDLSNQTELQRLLQLGLDVEKIRQLGKLGDHPFTRSIGDYNVKSGYKDIEILSTGDSEPVLAVPEMEGSVEIDECCSFLILMSHGLYRSLEMECGREHVNAEIASMVASEFNVQSTLNGVAQAVVDKVVRTHHDAYLVNVGQRKDMFQKREDITLLVRNFNHPLPYAIGSPTTATTGSSSTISQQNASINNGNNTTNSPNTMMPSSNSGGTNNRTQCLSPLSVLIPNAPGGGGNSPGRSPPHLHIVTSHTLTSTSTLISTLSSSTHRTYTNTSSNDSTQSGDGPLRGFLNQQADQKPSIPLDENGRVAAHVEFSMFYQAMEQLSEEERKELDAELEPRPAYETILEEDMECDGEFCFDEEID